VRLSGAFSRAAAEAMGARVWRWRDKKHMVERLSKGPNMPGWAQRAERKRRSESMPTRFRGRNVVVTGA